MRRIVLVLSAIIATAAIASLVRDAVGGKESVETTAEEPLYDSEVAWIAGDGVASYIQFPDVLNVVGATTPYQTISNFSLSVSSEGDFRSGYDRHTNVTTRIAFSMTQSHFRAWIQTNGAVRVQGSSSITNLYLKSFPKIHKIQLRNVVENSVLHCQTLVNDVLLVDVVNKSTDRGAPLRLFAGGVVGNSTTGWRDTRYFSSSQITGAKIERDGEVLLDAKAVRKGSKGYMFDSISGKLFGNEANSGEIIVGPDK